MPEDTTTQNPLDHRNEHEQPARISMTLTLPALERLLGGDSELEIQLRHQVVENFAKRHLRNLLVEDTQQMIESLHRTVRDELLPIIKAEHARYVPVSGWAGTRGLTETFRNTLKEFARIQTQEAVEQTIRQLIDEQMDAVSLRERIHKTVSQYVATIVKEQVRNSLQEQVAQLVRNLTVPPLNPVPSE